MGVAGSREKEETKEKKRNVDKKEKGVKKRAKIDGNNIKRVENEST